MYTIINKVYPTLNLNRDMFESKPRWGKSQWNLFTVVRRLFNSKFDQSHDILINFQHPELLYPGTMEVMELDIYIPSLKLAFEYQGKVH